MDVSLGLGLGFFALEPDPTIWVGSSCRLGHSSCVDRPFATHFGRTIAMKNLMLLDVM